MKNSEERFWAKVNKAEVNQCWEWTGARNSKGYGSFQINNVNWMPHRYSYTVVKGQIPDGLVIMHSCDNTRCVNPEHLFAVTQSENILDSAKKGRHHCVKRTHCPKGHEYTLENTLIKKQKRVGSPGTNRTCKECQRGFARAYYQKSALRKTEHKN